MVVVVAGVARLREGGAAAGLLFSWHLAVDDQVLFDLSKVNREEAGSFLVEQRERDALEFVDRRLQRLEPRPAVPDHLLDGAPRQRSRVEVARHARRKHRESWLTRDESVDEKSLGLARRRFE